MNTPACLQQPSGSSSTRPQKQHSLSKRHQLQGRRRCQATRGKPEPEPLEPGPTGNRLAATIKYNLLCNWPCCFMCMALSQPPTQNSSTILQCWMHLRHCCGILGHAASSQFARCPGEVLFCCRPSRCSMEHHFCSTSDMFP